MATRTAWSHLPTAGIGWRARHPSPELAVIPVRTTAGQRQGDVWIGEWFDTLEVRSDQAGWDRAWVRSTTPRPAVKVTRSGQEVYSDRKGRRGTGQVRK